MAPQFNASCLRCQTFLLDFCRELKEQPFIYPNSSNCWFEDFVIFAEKLGNRIPMKEEDFYETMEKFLDYSLEGRQALKKEQVGMVDGVIKYIEFEVEVDLGKRAPTVLKKPYYDQF